MEASHEKASSYCLSLSAHSPLCSSVHFTSPCQNRESDSSQGIHNIVAVQLKKEKEKERKKEREREREREKGVAGSRLPC